MTGRTRRAAGLDQRAAYEQFGGRCPVCGAPLGDTVPVDARSGRFLSPPCFQLDIGPSDASDHYAWRLTVIGINYPPATSTAPRFVEHEVEYVYVICGDGHIFPRSAPGLHHNSPAADASRRVDRWNMVAAVGALASGKTYLLIRMLSQELANTRNIWPENNSSRVRRHQLNPLEQVPLDLRSAEYSRTVSELRPMQPTSAEETRPAALLETLLPDVLEAVRETIRLTVVDGEQRAERWGMGFRQPLVIRTTSGTRVTWTGIADLPGELFTPDIGPRDHAMTPGRTRERAMLRSFDALIWVIDPAVSAAALDKLASDPQQSGRDEYDRILDGSLRPGTTRVDSRNRVRAGREQTQFEIGRTLTLRDSSYVSEHGRPLEMLVAVSKCDLIHAALRKQRPLDGLGEPGLVQYGVAAYLASVARRWAAMDLVADEQSRQLLHYLLPSATVQPDVRDRRVMQVADGLLKHYSNEDAFWQLVHGGARDTVRIPGSGDMALSGVRIDVLSIGEHQDQSTQPGAGERMLIRDLVMSAVGCGVAYGLGHDAALHHLFMLENQRIRFFLCSPLATVPVSRAERIAGDAAVYHLEPLEPDERFPRMGDRSAALIQLLLASLRKARA
ncbi:hypothetical protein ACQP2P_26700 [Dactylosporangium sp. CA-139114]|uniref:hypothetical protein n=1 Tax=Dactylosporangium sp. CA-139114 TaxID=3239931 RepID=UPI003D9990D0